MPDFPIDPAKPLGSARESMRQERISAQKMTKYVVNQKLTQEETLQWAEMDVFNPLAMQRRFKTLEKRQRKVQSKEDEAEQASSSDNQKVERIKTADEIAQYYHRRNRELTQDKLMTLLTQIAVGDSPEEILAKVQKMFPDPSLADEALEFLLSTMEDTPENRELAQSILQAKESLDATSRREVRAGRNIQNEAQLYSDQGLGTENMLRNLYRDITGNPREPNALFHELSGKYNFAQLKDVIGFLLYSLGADMSAKGPSIEPAELMRLFSETRVLQAILGVYYFFQGRMSLLVRFFKEHGLSWNPLLGFENLSKAFMKFLQERYPSSEKLLALAEELGIDEELLAQMIVFTQFRDATRHTSPRLYKSSQHKQDIYASIIDGIEEIDDELDQEEEEEDA